MTATLRRRAEQNVGGVGVGAPTSIFRRRRRDKIFGGGTARPAYTSTGSVPRMVSSRWMFGNLTLLQLLIAAVAVSGRCSVAIAVHCLRHRMYSLLTTGNRSVV
jgi:hypothetical protein